MPGHLWLRQEQVERCGRFDVDGAVFGLPGLASGPDAAFAVSDQPAQAFCIAPIERAVEPLEQFVRQGLDAAQIRAHAAFCTVSTSRFGAACTSFSASFTPSRSMNFCFQETDP